MAFEFFEVVRVVPAAEAPPGVQALRGQVGAVLGRSAEEGQEPTSYAIALDGIGESWQLDARDLVSTGEFRRREDYYDGSSVRVSDTGKLLP